MNIHQCPYRRVIEQDGDRQAALCGIVEQILGVRETELLEVKPDACETCCRSYPPSPGVINRVLASLLYVATDRIIARGGLEGCDPGKAAGIQTWADLNLEVVGWEPTVDYERLQERGVAALCHYFGDRLAEPGAASGSGPAMEPRFRCMQPHRSTTTELNCYRCRDWTRSPAGPPRDLRAICPPLQPRGGIRLERWVVGVTTAPRQQSTLRWSLDSLVRAGFEELRLFMDSKVELTERHRGIPVSLRDPKLGAWPNYYLSLAELLMREPHADAYLLVQDDVLLYDCVDVKEYLQGVSWPDDMGAASLYCSRAYTEAEAGWHWLKERWLWGALAFAFPNRQAKRFVSDPGVLEHRWSSHNDGLANIDSVVGAWAERHGLKIYFPTPSIVQHIGDASTIWMSNPAMGNRRADRFAGEER